MKTSRITISIILLFLAVAMVYLFWKKLEIVVESNIQPINLTGLVFADQEPVTSSVSVVYDAEIPTLIDEDEEIRISYTDENENEDVIIMTDKDIYSGFSSSVVYSAFTNKTINDQIFYIKYYFPKGGGDMLSSHIVKSDTWVEIKQSKYDRVDEIGHEKALQRAKQVPNSFEVKKTFKVNIKSGSTVFIKSQLTFEPSDQGEFWIEALGSAGGYGLLDPWFNSNWAYRKRIEIPSSRIAGSTNFTNFTILVSKSDPDLKHTSFGGLVASGGGGDILFTTSNGTTQIDHEIEKYSSSSGTLNAWVEIPTLNAATATVIYIYFGNASETGSQEARTATWNSNYKAVYHMGQDPSIATDGWCGNGSDEVCDSTSNGIDGVGDSGMTADDWIGAYIDMGYNFDGANTNSIDMGDNLDFDGTTAFSLSAWINKPTDTGNDDTIMGKKNGGGANNHTGYNFFVDDSDNDCTGNNSLIIQLINDNNPANLITVCGSTDIVDGLWHHVVMTYDGSQSASGVQFYLDGSPETMEIVDDSLTGSISNSSSFGLGCALNGVDCGNGNYWTGDMDEARIISAELGADWISTEYRNQSDPASFHLFSGLQVLRRSPPSVKVRGGTTVKGGVLVK